MFVPTVLPLFYVSRNIIQFQWQLCIIRFVGLCVFVCSDVSLCCISISGWAGGLESWNASIKMKELRQFCKRNTSSINLWDISRQTFWMQNDSKVHSLSWGLAICSINDHNIKIIYGYYLPTWLEYNFWLKILTFYNLLNTNFGIKSYDAAGW